MAHGGTGNCPQPQIEVRGRGFESTFSGRYAHSTLQVSFASVTGVYRMFTSIKSLSLLLNSINLLHLVIFMWLAIT